MPPNPASSLASGTTPAPEPNSKDTSGKSLPEVVDAKPEAELEEASCGCGPVRFQFLQGCLRPIYFLLFLSLLALCQTMVVTGYSSAILTTIEVRYDFMTSELGLIVSSYDFASVLAGVVVSYYGDRYCRPVWLSRGALVMGIGSLLWTVPFFVNPYYDPLNNAAGDNTSDAASVYKLCRETEISVPANNVTSTMEQYLPSLVTDTEMCEASMGSKSNTWALPIFMVAFMIIGFGASPVWTLGPTFLYDNTPRASYPIYAGVFYSMGALGPALGFVISAAILQMYVIPWDTPAGIDDSSASWIGAWWVGFVLTSGLLVLVAIPLACFPKSLPYSQENDKEAGKDVNTKDNSDDFPVNSSLGNNLKDLPRHIWSLVSNPLWLFVTLALCTEQAIGVGFSRYISKYLEVVYHYTASSANIMTGAVLIPAAALGVIFGGLIMRKLTLNTRDLTLLLFTINFIPLSLLAVLTFVGCEGIEVTAVSQFMSATGSGYEGEDLPLGSCLTGCSCDSAPYGPVCGADGNMFTSACAAGCRMYNQQNLTFSDCACVNGTSGTQDVTLGACTAVGVCSYAPVYLIVLFLSVFITTGGQTPILLITLRSVNRNVRSFALGIQNFLVQLLVFVPAPIYFGEFFDSQCTHRKLSECDTQGACLAYNEDSLRLVFQGAGVGFKFCTGISLFLAYIAARRKENQIREQEQLNQVDKNCAMTKTNMSNDRIIECTRF